MRVKRDPTDSPTVRDARIVRALANPVRLRLVAAIGPRGETGDRLAARFPELPPDMFAWHLWQLRECHLVSRTRATSGDRRLYVYRLDVAAFRALADRLTTPADSY